MMIEPEHKLLCTHKVSRQPCKSKIAQLSWFRHHLTQPLHTELNVESSTGHVDADACILLIQLSFHLFQLVQRFWIASAPRGPLLPGELCGFAPTLERFLTIAARCLRSSSHSNPCPLMYTMCLFRCCPCSAALGPTRTLTTTKLLQYSIQTIQFLGFSFRDDAVAVDCSHRVRLKAVINLVTYLECCIPCFFENLSLCSWKRRDARLVPYIARFICHMYPASSSHRGGYIAIGSSCGNSAFQNATLIAESGSTRECPPLVFLIDAALEMMILMHLRGCSASECIKSYTMGHFHRNESAAHEWSICSLFHLIKPLTTDFLTSSHRDRNTFKQLMSGHCIVLSLSFQPSPSVETTVYLSFGHRLVCRLSRV